MFGFNLIINSETNLPAIASKSDVVVRQTVWQQLKLQQFTLNKFLDDKLFVQDDEYIYSLEGILLNFDELCEKYSCNRLSLLPLMYKQKGESFVAELRGNFSIVFCDKISNTCFVYTDQIGSRFLFYQTVGTALYLSSSIVELCRLTRNKSFDKLGMYDLLCCGFQSAHHTIVENIRRIPAGCYLRIMPDKIELKQYHRFTDSHIVKQSKEKYAANMERLLRQAVNRVLSKNKEYGYANFFPLSAGLDSRMVNFLARELTNDTIINFTYAEKGTQDAIVPPMIAEYLGNQLIFRSQDDHHFLTYFQKAVEITDAQIAYGGAAEAYDLWEKLDKTNVGIVPNGVGGDCVVATPIPKREKQYSYADFSMTPFLYDELRKLIPDDYSQWYESKNINALYVVNFECHGLGSPCALRSFAESYSPFLDVDFLEYYLTIDPRERKDYSLYDYWIQQYHPQAMQWLHNGAKIGHRSKVLHIGNRTVALNELLERISGFIKRRIQMLTNRQTNKNTLPTEDIAETFCDDFFKQNLHLLDFDKQLCKHAAEQYCQSSFPPAKLAALTLLASVKMISEIGEK